jgi:hypothetical protein
MIDQQLRDLLAADPRSIYELAAEMIVEPDVLYRFRDGKDIRLATAAKLADVLGLTLTHATKSTTKGRQRGRRRST